MLASSSQIFYFRQLVLWKPIELIFFFSFFFIYIISIFTLLTQQLFTPLALFVFQLATGEVQVQYSDGVTVTVDAGSGSTRYVGQSGEEQSFSSGQVPPPWLRARLASFPSVVQHLLLPQHAWAPHCLRWQECHQIKQCCNTCNWSVSKEKLISSIQTVLQIEVSKWNLHCYWYSFRTIYLKQKYKLTLLYQA